ncbi:AAA family ATPase [Streptomyces sp. 8N114]|uniref:AAA family ATPase n=1 Tax=Streptomyces sp. 8N114 TaxID=3457419 RepID=UPI003FD11AC7
MTFQPLDTTIPDPAVIVLIGPAGSGKSTLASTWEPTQILSLDHYRALVSDEAGDQAATGDAVFALHRVLEARLRRGLTSVLDATHTEAPVRAHIIQTARCYGIPTVALLVPTPLEVCLERNAARADNRRVPEDTVRAQHRAVVDAHPRLRQEGFDHVVFASSIDRLGPLLHRASQTRRRELGWDGGDGLGDELLLRRFFGPALVALASWKSGSTLANGDRVLELRAGAASLTLALRLNADGEGDIGFDVLLPCPVTENDTEDGERCPGPAWVPVYNSTDLHRAYLGELENDEDLVCTHCGYRGEVDHEAADWEAGADDAEDGVGLQAVAS